MANPKGNPGTLAPPFAPGNNANPGGKPVGARNRLQGKFLADLADDFDKHGKKAIEDMRTISPAKYVQCVASLMPKEIELSRPLEGMSDDELVAAVAALQSFLAAQDAAGGGKPKARRKQAPDVPSVH